MTTINRSTVSPCLQEKYLILGIKLSFTCFVAVPVFGLLLWLSGVLLKCLAFVAVGVGWFLSVWLLLRAGEWVFKKNRDPARCLRQSLLVVPSCCLAAIISKNGSSVIAWGRSGEAVAASHAKSMMDSIFYGEQLYLLSWLPLLSVLIWFLLVLLVLMILRGECFLRYQVMRFWCTCPICASRGVPRFLCTGCGEPVVGLMPTRFGLFSVRCANCQASLPTSDLCGRLDLTRLCPNPDCGSVLSQPGKYAEVGIVFWGAKGSGKSNLMVAAVRSVRDQSLPRLGLKMEFESLEMQDEFEGWCKLHDQGIPMPKTVTSGTPMALSFTIKDASDSGRLLYIYDADGSHYESPELLERHFFHKKADGVVLLIDPEKESTLRRGLHGADLSDLGSGGSLDEGCAGIVERLIERFEQAHSMRPDAVSRVSVAVVVSKIDDERVAHRLGAASQRCDESAGVAERLTFACYGSDTLREFLLENGLGNVVRSLEGKFRCVKYFTASSLGRSVFDSRSPFRPREAWAPLFWLFVQNRVISDLEAPTGYLLSKLRRWGTGLTGQRGAAVAISSWLLIVVIVMAAVSVIILR